MLKTILLIDDDEEEFFILKLALDLAAIDYHCIWANGLEQASHLVKELTPDYIFIDINMPRNNGITCLRSLKDQRSLQHTVFIMYSTYISHDNHALAMELGASRCIHKSENINLLLKQLKNLFNDKTLWV